MSEFKEQVSDTTRATRLVEQALKTVDNAENWTIKQDARVMLERNKVPIDRVYTALKARGLNDTKAAEFMKRDMGYDAESLADLFRRNGMTAAQVLDILMVVERHDWIVEELKEVGYSTTDIARALNREEARNEFGRNEPYEVKPFRTATDIAIALGSSFSYEEIAKALKEAKICKTTEDIVYALIGVGNARGGATIFNIAQTLAKSGLVDNAEDMAKTLKQTGYSSTAIYKALKDLSYSEDEVKSALSKNKMTVKTDVLQSVVKMVERNADKEVKELMKDKYSSINHDPVYVTEILHSHGYGATEVVAALVKNKLVVDAVDVAVVLKGYYPGSEIALALKENKLVRDAADVAYALKEAGVVNAP